MDRKRVASDSFDTMWSFLQMGCQKADYSALKEYVLQLRQMMMQKTAGQRSNKKSDISFEDLDQIKNMIVLEAMALVLSGEYEKS